MTIRRTVVAALIGAAAVAAVFAQGPPSRFDAVDFTVVPVAGSVSMLQVAGGGGNVGVLAGPDGVLLVDAQFAPLTDKLVAAVRRIADAPIRFLVNTHVHIDHTGGNENLARRGVVILAHENVRRRMLKELRIPRRGGQFFPQPAEEARPLVTYRDSVTFHLNGEEVRAFLAPPAHTDGDTFVYFRDADVLHTGDVFRTTSYPIIDQYNGGTLDGMIEATRLALELSGPRTRVIPGHGLAVTDRRGVEEVLDMLLDIRDLVQRLVDEGRTLAEVMAARPTARYDEQWGREESWTAADFVPIVYDELTR